MRDAVDPRIKEMHIGLLRYFLAEKRGSLLFLLAGGAALAAGMVLVAGRGPHRGMAFPLLAFGLLELAVGGAVYFRTDGQVAALVARLQADPSAYAAEERARMARVMGGFRVYRWTELLVLAGGLFLRLRYPDHPALASAGLGCVLQAGILLALDFAAARRGQAYLDSIRRLPAEARNPAAGAP